MRLTATPHNASARRVALRDAEIAAGFFLVAKARDSRLTDAEQQAKSAAVTGHGKGYRATTVCRIIGCSYRQLDYWNNTGLVTATECSFVAASKGQGSGNARLYSLHDCMRLRVVKDLLDVGLSLQRVRVIMHGIDTYGLSITTGTLVVVHGCPHIAYDDHEVLDLLRKNGGVFAIPLRPRFIELRERLAVIPAEDLMLTRSGGRAVSV